MLKKLNNSEDAKEIKREKLYEAVIALIEKGENHSSIKVSEIASEAGIGKGTVYEYFSSREEIIARTVIYYINKYLVRAEKIFEKESGFRDRMWGIFDIITKEAKRSEFFFDILLTTGKVAEIYKILKSADISPDFENDIRKYIEVLVEDGIKEGVLSPGISPDYAGFVIGGAISAFIGAQHNSKLSKDEKLKRREYAYEMIVRALN